MKLAIEPQYVPSPLSLPERSSGELSIRHRIVTGITPIISMRQAVLRGIAPCNLKLSGPLVVHELIDKKHGLWMTDLPEELFQIAEAIAATKPRGNVLVGGLGLGLMAGFLAHQKTVKHVTVIERSADVITLCADDRFNTVTTIKADLFRYLKRKNVPAFDCYMLDIWQMTNESAWWSTVLPLRRLIRNRWGKKSKIWCWAEDIMIGQVMPHLLGSDRSWKYKNLPLPMSKREAQKFIRDIGIPEWEEKYGKLIDQGDHK